jgi:penicillin-binding protein 2
VVYDPKGTAYKARSHRIEVAGKTGTAQVWRGGRVGKDDPPLLYERVDHAWFAGFAPASKPRIAFAVLVEHGGHGGAVAAPVAMEIVENYFDTVAPTEEKIAPRPGHKVHARGAVLPAALDGEPSQQPIKPSPAPRIEPAAPVREDE